MKRYCRNCHYPLVYKAKYCAHCGQRDTDGRVTMWSMLKRLWNNTFHLEGKFIRASWQLFIPGKMTLAFFKGKIERYPHPLRFFAIIMFFFLLLVNSNLRRAENSEGPGKPGKGIRFSAGGGEIYYKIGQQYALLQEQRSYFDSLPAALRTPAAEKAFDSVLYRTAAAHQLGDTPLFGVKDSLGQVIGMDSIHLSLGQNKLTLSAADLFRYEPEELIERYGIQGWVDKLMVKQGVKSMRDPNGLVHAYIGNLTWTILALIALMSGILALLYWRQHRYYVEHFVFLLHFHSAILLAFTLLLGINLLTPVPSLFWKIASIWPIPALYIGMRRFYRQGRLKTFLKWAVFGLAYVLSFFALATLGFVVVLAIF